MLPLVPRGIQRLLQARDINGSPSDEQSLEYNSATQKNDWVTHLLSNGSRVGATSQAQTFTNGIISNSNIGINRTPSRPLDIDQSADTQAIRINGFDDQSSSNMTLAINAGGSGFVATTSNILFSSGGLTTFSSFDDIRFQDSSSNRLMTILDSGEVGIGLSTPLAQLDIKSPTSTLPSIRFRFGTIPSSSVAGSLYPSTDGTDLFYHDGTTAQSLISGGGGGTPGGSDTQVQYNDSGAFSGDAGMTYDAANNELSVGGGVITDSIRPALNSIDALEIQDAAGSSIITVDTTNDRVGINTAPGDFALNVQGSTFNIVRFRRANSNNAAITFENSAGEFYFGVTKTDADFAVSTSTSLHSGSFFKVTRSGNVGINEQSPTALLHIGPGSVSRSQIRFDPSSNPTSPNDGDIWLNTSGALNIHLSGVTNMFATGQQQTGGLATAGAIYTSTEQDMIQKVYDAAREFGILD